MPAPSALIEVELTPGVWTDISDYLVEATVRRGGSFALGRIEAAEARLTFENDDGRFTPDLPGPYYPDLRPRRRFRITDATAVEPVFFGKIERIRPAFDTLNPYHLVQFIAVDESKSLQVDLTPVAVAESLLDAPVALFPLDDAKDSQPIDRAYGSALPMIIGNELAPYGQPATATLGSDNIAPGLPGGTCLELRDFDYASVAGAIKSTPGLAIAAAFTLTSDLALSTAPTIVGAFGADGSYLLAFCNAVFGDIVLSYAGAGGAGAAAVQFSGPPAVHDGQLHHLVLSLATDKRSITTVLDGTTDTIPVWNTGVDLNLHGGTLFVGGGDVGSPVLKLSMLGSYPELTVARAAAQNQALRGAGGDTEADRINRLLDYAGDTGTRALDTGVSTMGLCAWTYGAKAWAEAAKTASDSGGRLFIGRQGDRTYHSRDRRYLATSPTFTLSASAGSGIEGGLNIDYSDQALVNDWTISPASGQPQRAQDAASVAEFDVIAKSEDTRLGSTDEAYQRAHYLARTQGNPRPTLETVVVDLSTMADSALATQNKVVASEVSTRFRVEDFPSTAPWSAHDWFVEGLTHTISRRQRPKGGDLWRVTLNVSPPDPAGGWIIGDPVYGLIGDYPPVY